MLDASLWKVLKVYSRSIIYWLFSMHAALLQTWLFLKFFVFNGLYYKTCLWTLLNMRSHEIWIFQISTNFVMIVTKCLIISLYLNLLANFGETFRRCIFTRAFIRLGTTWLDDEGSRFDLIWPKNIFRSTKISFLLLANILLRKKMRLSYQMMLKIFDLGDYIKP